MESMEGFYILCSMSVVWCGVMWGGVWCNACKLLHVCMVGWKEVVSGSESHGT